MLYFAVTEFTRRNGRRVAAVVISRADPTPRDFKRDGTTIKKTPRCRTLERFCEHFTQVLDSDQWPVLKNTEFLNQQEFLAQYRTHLARLDRDLLLSLRDRAREPGFQRLFFLPLD